MTDEEQLHKATQTPSTGIGTSVSGLPPDVLHQASRRLGWAGLVYAATFFFAFFGPHFFLKTTSAPDAMPPGLFEGRMLVQTIVSILSITSGLLIFLMSRRCRAAHEDTGRLNPAALLDFGLIFLVIGSLGISVATMWGMYPPSAVGAFEAYLAEEGFVGIPWECVWIVFYPVVAPNTPGKTLVAALAAASTGLFTITLSKAVGLTSPDVTLGFFFVYYLFTTYLCAGIAFVISKVVYGFGRQLRRAREVGSYQLVELLGEGGMGEVWLAKHRMLARPAAVKLIRAEALGSDPGASETLVRRFEREAQATAALGSKHTIDLYDFGVTEQGAFYYVMELLKGLNLDALVRRFGPIPAARTIHLMRQVCHSLGEAHESGLVHRDVKPANIYVCRLGPDYDFVKVLDFGLVKARKADSAATELTAEGIATGTPAFMAPEMALGKADIDGRADLYALGCVGYWLLTGERVFEGENALATVVAHVQDSPIPPSQRTELEVPESLERIILACLEKDREARPQSAAELDLMLAKCALGDEWGSEKAKGWWTLHMADQVAAVAAAAEHSPQSILAVRYESTAGRV